MDPTLARVLADTWMDPASTLRRRSSPRRPVGRRPAQRAAGALRRLADRLEPVPAPRQRPCV